MMNKIAFVFGETFIYWNSVMMALAVLTGLLFFWGAFIRRSENIAGAAILCPVAIVVSFFFARLIHWYFRADSYDGFFAAITDFSGSGYALSGAFFGCMISALLLSLLKIVKDLPLTLDCMSIGGCAAIAVGRLASFFTGDNRGDILNVTNLPLAYPVVNTTSGLVEYRFATFLFQAIIAFLIFTVLLALFLKTPERRKFQNGDISLLFLLMYCASQIVLDSTRYDALRLRSNGFISVVQVFSALALVFVIMLFSLRLCKHCGWKPGYIPIWLLIATGIGVAAYMEYHVQRHGDQALFGYSVMSACLGLVVLMGFVLWRMANAGRGARKRYQGKFSR